MLVGRQVEVARVEALLDAAREGRGGALVLRGLAGSGKSTLLAHLHQAADVRVLATSGVESESPLGYAALQRLLWPLRSGIDQLPVPQRDALRAVMGEAAGAGDRFLVSLATLSLLSDAAEEQPLVVAVDDAHWLDEATTGALLFVARRLAAERVAMVFAVRDGSARTFEAPDLDTVEVAGLDPEAAATLLASYAEEGLDPAVVSTLHAAGGGIPLVLVELAKSLTPAQLAGRAALPTPLPLTDGVQQAFLERSRRLSASAQRYLLVLAADDTGSIAVTHEAARTAGLEEEAVEEAERADLVRVQGLHVDLYHPLVRSAIYQAATGAERRAAHHALAQALSGDPDRRAWHLAAASDRPDGSVVEALVDVARRAAARGGHDAASAAWSRASELTVDPGQRAELLALAATASWEAGRPGRAQSLASAASELTPDPGATIGLLTLRGRIEWTTRSLDEGYDLILQAAALAAEVEGAGSEAARRLAMVAASLAAFGGSSDRGLDPSTVITEPAPDAPPTARVTHLLLHGFLAAARRDWSLLSLLQSALALAEEIAPVTDGVLQANLGIAALHLGDDVRGSRLHADQLLAARRAGALSMVEHALKNGALFQIATGEWGRASAAAEEALALGADAGQPSLTALPRAELALLAALRGDDAAADEHLERVGVLIREPVGVTRVLVTDLMHWTQGLRATQPETALQHLERMSGVDLPRTAAVDRLETAVRAGRRDLAEAWAADLLGFAEATGTASALAAGEHGRALLAEGAEAEAAFERALLAHAQSPRIADRARTRLAYGEWLRRTRRRVDAREHLRAAHATFEELGAARWAERASQELRASGETARRRDPSTARDLTAQERQVAALVRQGLSNRDVAAQLFVSPRTVDFHLRNVFTKLGLSSRAELAALPDPAEAG